MKFFRVYTWDKTDRLCLHVGQNRGQNLKRIASYAVLVTANNFIPFPSLDIHRQRLWLASVPAASCLALWEQRSASTISLPRRKRVRGGQRNNNPEAQCHIHCERTHALFPQHVLFKHLHNFALTPNIVISSIRQGIFVWVVQRFLYFHTGAKALKVTNK